MPLPPDIPVKTVSELLWAFTLDPTEFCWRVTELLILIPFPAILESETLLTSTWSLLRSSIAVEVIHWMEDFARRKELWLGVLRKRKRGETEVIPSILK